MKFTLDKYEIGKVFFILTKIITKDIGNVLSDSVFIKVKKEKLSIISNQFDFFFKFEKKVSDSEDGECTITPSTVDGIVNSIVDSNITFDKKENKLSIITKSSKTEINTLSTEELSLDDKKEGSDGIEFDIEREIFVKGLKTVIHSCETSVFKKEIGSVYITTKEKTIYFVATDSFRLSEVRFNTDEIKDGVVVLIPFKNVNKIIRVLESISTAKINIVVYKENIKIKSDEITIISSVVDGNYPDYKTIIPKEFDLEFVVLKSDFVNFTKKAKYFANSLSKVEMKLLSNNQLSLKFENDTGSTEDIIPVGNVSGKLDVPSFNYKYINDALQNVQDDKVVFRFVEGSAKPLLIRGVQETIFTEVISPLIES